MNRHFFDSLPHARCGPMHHGQRAAVQVLSGPPRSRSPESHLLRQSAHRLCCVSRLGPPACCRYFRSPAVTVQRQFSHTFHRRRLCRKTCGDASPGRNGTSRCSSPNCTVAVAARRTCDCELQAVARFGPFNSVVTSGTTVKSIHWPSTVCQIWLPILASSGILTRLAAGSKESFHPVRP